jgi:6-phosphogluconolactonase
MATAESMGAVYLMTNQDTGNSMTVFRRSPDGSLTRLGTFPTGGLGTGNSIDAQNDPLGSQGALALSEDGRFLFAVDAGSNEVSVLAINGEKLQPVDRVSSRGTRPNSVTAHKNLLYVVNHDDATLAGFTVGADGKLTALPGNPTALGSSNADPGQVRFTPDGTRLVVTEKGTDMIDVCAVDGDGHAGSPIKSNSNGRVPFGSTFAGKDLLIVSELSNATSSYRIAPDGTLKVVSGSVPTEESGACWVVTNSVDNPQFAYVSNAVSGSITGYRIDTNGALHPLSPDGHSAITRDAHAALDSAVSSDGKFLYVLTAGFNELSDQAVGCNKMTISAFRIVTDGSLDVLAGFGTADSDPGAPQGLAPGSQGIVAI